MMLQKIKRLIAVTVLMLTVCLMPVMAPATEVVYPVAAYNGEALAKVRAWEKSWVGKKIDKNNVDQVSEFLPQAFADAYKNPKKWGAPDDAYFMITAYKQFVDTPGMIAATKKYAPLVKVAADGWIENYADLAGVPFPSPKTGQDLAWNFDFNTHGDANHYTNSGPVITPGESVERRTKTERWELYWVHRVDVGPLPKYEKNKKGIHRGMFQHMFEPPESNNTRFYNLRYIDPAKSDDGYMYYAPFRRIRRISVGQRTDTIDGSDFIYDDEYGWDGHVQRNTYKLSGRKELLCSRRADISKYERTPGQAIPSNIVRERINTYVVEVKSKDPNYIYGKRVWYLDPETYLVSWTDIYDDLGKFWKCFEVQSTEFASEQGGTKILPSGYITLDVQRKHAANLLSAYKKVGQKKVDMKMFTISNLQKTY
ncbi:MAG: DUF1329 domain-containing protein [Deltaproteobacteria bacterium]|nr:DUF1329 domain-containing protein [Deltaproteobacteria bacterium]